MHVAPVTIAAAGFARLSGPWAYFLGAGQSLGRGTWSHGSDEP